MICYGGPKLCFRNVWGPKLISFSHWGLPTYVVHACHQWKSFELVVELQKIRKEPKKCCVLFEWAFIIDSSRDWNKIPDQFQDREPRRQEWSWPGGRAWLSSCRSWRPPCTAGTWWRGWSVKIILFEQNNSNLHLKSNFKQMSLAFTLSPVSGLEINRW